MEDYLAVYLRQQRDQINTLEKSLNEDERVALDNLISVINNDEIKETVDNFTGSKSDKGNDEYWFDLMFGGF